MTGRREPFAETVAQLRLRAAVRPRVAEGRDRGVWGDPEGVAYRLVTASLASGDAMSLARHGARVVFDACGCGGAECRLDWLSDADVRTLVDRGVPPVLRPGRDTRADLEHWRSPDGRNLVVAAVAVSWGTRF